MNVNKKEIFNLQKILKTLSHITRIRIVCLVNERNLCAKNIQESLKVSQVNVSRQVKILTQAKLLTESKYLQQKHYSVNKDVIYEFPFLKDLISKLIETDPKIIKDKSNYLLFGNCACQSTKKLCNCRKKI